MKIADHTLKEELDNYFSFYKIDRNKVMTYKAWAMISGPQLSAVTMLKNIKNGVLKVYTTSSSARTLLSLKKKKIIEDYNKMYPELKIVDLQIIKKG